MRRGGRSESVPPSCAQSHPSPRTAAQIRGGGGSGGGQMNEVHRDKETSSAHGRRGR